MTIENLGNQTVGWRYRTPLNSDGLNTFMSGLVTPGLMTRPADVMGTENTSIDVPPFMVAVNDENQIDQNHRFGGNINPTVIKISIADTYALKVSREHVVVAIRYSRIVGGVITQAYAELVGLKAEEITADTVVVYRIFWKNNGEGNAPTAYLTTRGATISNVLLYREGWCNGWFLDMCPPYSALNGTAYDYSTANKLVIRNVFNQLANFNGYVSGNDPKQIESTSYNKKLVVKTDFTNTVFDTGMVGSNSSESATYKYLKANNFPKNSGTLYNYYVVSAVYEGNSIKLVLDGFDVIGDNGSLRSDDREPVAVIEVADSTKTSSYGNIPPVFNCKIKPVVCLAPKSRAIPIADGSATYDICM